MHVDSPDPRRDPRSTPERSTPERATSVGWFELSGRTFSLVPADVWRRRKSALDPIELRDAEAVGRIEFDGARLIVVLHETDDAHDREVLAVDMLTRREMEVAMLVSKGKCDKEIARALGISGYTVREHLRRTAAKLGVSRRTAIVSLVLQGQGSSETLAARLRSPDPACTQGRD
jgi:DNA-binding CsgD family transcriptional regulator